MQNIRTENDEHESLSHKEILYTPYISRRFYFREFREAGAISEINNTLKYSLQFHYH